MYRHPQQISAPNGHFQANTSMHSWYAPGYHQSPQIGTAAPSNYCVQEDQQIWHHHSTHPHTVSRMNFQISYIPEFQPYNILNIKLIRKIISCLLRRLRYQAVKCLAPELRVGISHLIRIIYKIPGPLRLEVHTNG